jgi:hypothetical protein
MNETPEVVFNAPPKKKKPAKKKSKPAAPKNTAPFAGMTHTACATACDAKTCVISGKPYCAHPTKGGLQYADQDPAALKRLQAAREQIRVTIDPDRFK